MIRQFIGKMFIASDDRIFERSLKMPSNTAQQREMIFCYRRRGIREDVYKILLTKSRRYALKKAKNDSLYDYYFGLYLRVRVFIYKLHDIISYFVSPYKYGCKF